MNTNDSPLQFSGFLRIGVINLVNNFYFVGLVLNPNSNSYHGQSTVKLIVFLFYTIVDENGCCFLIPFSHRYVDDTMRIGRDDKGNIFVLERFEDSNS